MKQLYRLRVLRLTTFLCLFLSFAASAQVQTARYTKIISKVNAYWEYLPEGYNPAGTQTYPLILSLPGWGNMGDGSPEELPMALSGQVGTWIRAGYFPKSFTVKGQTFKFIVITPQFIKSPWPTPVDIDSVLNFVVKNYKVDLSRIYLSGLSYGGGLCWSYISYSTRFGNRIAAISPTGSTGNLDTTRCRNIAAANVAVWVTHNDEDPRATYINPINNVDRINIPPAPYPPAKYTIFHDTTHNSWTKFYDPRPKTSYREDGLNVYEWMLQFKRGSTTTTSGNIAPKANAGIDQTITLPKDSAILSGSGTDADDSITYYRWRKISGPTKGYVRSSGLKSVYAKYLVAGTYLFELTVTDSRRAIGRDTIKVTVNSSTTTNQPPKANAGADKTITLPTNSVALSGSATDADGTIASYLWSKISGPSSFTFSSTTVPNPTVSNLVGGSYTFRLTVKDNKGATGYDDVIVTVNSSTTTTRYVRVNIYGGSNPYTQSSWNNWNVGTTAKTNISSGPLKYWDGTSSTVTAVLSHTRSIGDNGSSYGSTVSNKMAPTEVLRYTSISDLTRTLTISGLSTSKKYNVELYNSRNRVYSTILTVNGVSQTIDVYNNYTKKGLFTNLTPNSTGKIIITIKSARDFNHLNGFILTEQGSTSTTAAAISNDSEQHQVDATGQQASTALRAFPNPVQDQLVLQLHNSYKGTLTIQLLDMSGRKLKEVREAKLQEQHLTTLSVGELTKGNYLIRVQGEDWIEITKVTKR